MKRRDWFLRVMVALLVVGVWVLILRPVLAPTPIRAAEAATAAQDEVRAERFVLVDEEGTERAVLGFAHGEEASLVILDPQGKALVNLGVDTYKGPAKGALRLLDAEGRPGVEVAFTPATGAVFVGVPHKQGRPSAGLSMESGGVSLYVTGADRKSYGTMEVTATGKPRLRLTDSKGEVVFSVPTDDEGAAPLGAEASAAAQSAAKSCFDHLREGNLSEAAKWVTFESERAREDWEQQAADYGAALAAGGRPWWGQPFKVQLIPGPPPGDWAVAEVQWRYLAGMGWMMGEHYTYRLRTVDGEWKLYVDEATTERGIPWAPTGEP